MDNVPSTQSVLALDGRSLESLSDVERKTLNFFGTHGRMYGVAVSIINKADPADLGQAKTEAEADDIMRRANKVVSVTNVSAPPHLNSKPGSGKTSDL